MRDECHVPIAVLKLAVAVIAIALPDSINPSLIGGELFVATGPHPRLRTAAFTVGALTIAFVFGLTLAVGLAPRRSGCDLDSPKGAGEFKADR